MLGIVIPAHNEESGIVTCVASVMQAARHPALREEPVEIIVVLDNCSDATGILAAGAGAATVTIRARNVGMARAAGAEAALARGARWLAFTDADTRVAPDWLVEQLALDADAVCGTVGVSDWSPHGEHADLLHAHFLETYTDLDGHRHIHGANLGVTARAYENVGGFRPLVSSEDVALVEALRDTGASIAWSAAPRVVTSARRRYRAPGGFGETLARVDRQLASAGGVQGACE